MTTAGEIRPGLRQIQPVALLAIPLKRLRRTALSCRQPQPGSGSGLSWPSPGLHFSDEVREEVGRRQIWAVLMLQVGRWRARRSTRGSSAGRPIPICAMQAASFSSPETGLKVSG